MIESIKDLLQKEAQAVLNIPITDAVSYTHLTLPTT